MKRILVLLAVLTVSAPGIGHARAGDLDSTFGRYGFSYVNFGNADFLTDLAVQKDGKILLGGWTYVKGAPDFALARLSSKGTLDTGFGSRGKTTASFGHDDKVVKIASAPGGKVVAAGNAMRLAVSNGQPFEDSDFAIARFTSKGKLDTTFGGTGRVLLDWFGNRSNGEVLTALAVQPDGKIVVGGNTLMHTRVESPFGVYETDTKLALLARYASDGTLDPTFGTGGRLVLNLGSPVNVSALSVKSDGTILVGGTIWSNSDPPDGDAYVMRLTSAGALDPTFGIGGYATSDFGGLGDRVATMGIGKDGKIVVAGTTSRRYEVYAAMSRFGTTGTLDKTFSSDGTSTVKIGGGQSGVQALAVQSDGKIVVSAMGMRCISARYNGKTYKFCIPSSILARFTKSGSYDKTFGSGGTVIPNLPVSPYSFMSQGISAIGMQSDRAVLGGMFGGGDGYDFSVMRLKK